MLLRKCSRVLIPIAAAIAVAGCSGMHESPDFIRHTYSQLSEPYDRDDVLYFDVRFDPSYPDGDPAAEALRMEWLAAWLEQRRMCPGGHEVTGRRPFDTLEYNPGRYDIRYEVRCKIAM